MDSATVRNVSLSALALIGAGYLGANMLGTGYGLVREINPLYNTSQNKKNRKANEEALKQSVMTNKLLRDLNSKGGIPAGIPRAVRQNRIKEPLI